MDNKTIITTYAGLKESMGAIFSVVYGNDRVIMDFGSAFKPETANYVKKNNNWIIEKLDLGLLPKIEGLYPKNYLNNYNLQAFEDSDYNSAIFVSHLHLDHMSSIGAVHQNVPVYMSNTACKIEYALEDLNMGVDSIGRTYSSFDNLKEVKIGKISVTPIANSFNSYCMYGFLIQTPDLKIGYTADFSMCYEMPELVKKELRIFKQKDIDVLYMDNCNFTDETLKNIYHCNSYDDVDASLNIPLGMCSFAEHYEHLANIYKNIKGLIVFNHYEREMYDVQKIEEWAKLDNRIVVYEPKAAYLVSKFFNKHVYVYYNNEHIIDDWFKDLCNNASLINREMILKNPNKYILNLNFKNSNELYNLNVPNSVYIHANGDPFNSKDYKILQDIVKKAGYEFQSYDDKTYYQHGYPNHVKYFVKEVMPKVVIGYHGDYPERIKINGVKNVVCEYYKPYIFLNNNLVLKELNK